MNLLPETSFAEQLLLIYELANNDQNNLGVKIYNLFCLIVFKYVIHFHTCQQKMTAQDSADKLLMDIAEAGATAAWNIVNFVLDKCKLIYAGADLQ